MPNLEEISTLTHDIVFLVGLAGRIGGTACFCIFVFVPIHKLLKANIFIRVMLVIGAWAYVLTQLSSDSQSVGGWMITICFAIRFLCELDWKEYFKGGLHHD